MPDTRYNALLIGCGLAGATLAWRLNWAGYRLLVFDKPDHESASRVAAGLISPVSGKRHRRTSGWDSYWPDALAFYRHVEQQTKATLLTLRPQIRLINHDEAKKFSDTLPEKPAAVASNLPYFSALTETTQNALSINTESAVLDVAQFLDVTFEMLNEHHCLRREQLGHEKLLFDDGLVRLSNEEITAENIVFCEGWRARDNPLFNTIEFEPARGETIQIDCADLPANYTYHYGFSVVPHGAKSFIVGATYERNALETGPTASGKQQLVDSTTNMISAPFSVTAHRSGVRPIIKGREPRLLQHSEYAGCWFFNGLASKGCLWAPRLSRQLAQAITDVEPLPQSSMAGAAPETRNFSDTRIYHRERLTTVAHNIIREFLKDGDIAIDATAGNGNDTLLLAKLTAPNGRVYAIDTQAIALQRSAQRLAEIRADHVRLLCADHADLAALIPDYLHGKVSVIAFNLGYLPGGDETIVTQVSSSTKAVGAALRFLKQGGLCSILCYRGHAGGQAETDAISGLLDKLDTTRYRVERHASDTTNVVAPLLFIVKKN